MNFKQIAIAGVLCLLITAGCRQTPPAKTPPAAGDKSATKTTRKKPPGSPASKPRRKVESPKPAEPIRTKRDYKVVHVFVALCDNRHQGIVKVPASLGNGQDPRNNLYWGAMYGLRTYFRKSKHWKLHANVSPKPGGYILDRIILESTGPGPKVYILADAYDGRAMKLALERFFAAAAGRYQQRINIKIKNAGGALPGELDFAGRADMVCFVGHNGLMDMAVEFPYRKQGQTGPDRTVVLACKSQLYFAKPLRLTGCVPLITTSGFMAPEAYTLDAIIRSWAADQSPAAIREAAAKAYAKYQRCSLSAARRLFVTGKAK